ncbi:MAG: DNA-protecting protein DprA [Calditrichaeota bacterium]|nr:MAG: DNA-protecting protein DprA [Calditrichota bacterium]
MENWWAVADEMALFLNLSQIHGIGPARIRTLLNRFAKPSKIVSASIDELTKIGGINESAAHAIQSAESADFGLDQLQKAVDQNCQILACFDNRYPEKLKRIPNPPLVLYTTGQISVFNSFAIAIVGTRLPTAYGKNITIKLTRELVESGVTIVSGLARGIDTIAHTETVKYGGQTMAVLGSGLDVLYPSENKKLASEICKNGLLVTEFAFGTKPDAINFPKRNRIISGLTAGTVVTEAGEKSGALITAYQALDQNREVFAVPGSIFSKNHAGPNQLIKEGAKLVTSVADIFDELPQQGDLFSPVNSGKMDAMRFSNNEKEIIDLLKDGEHHIDKLSRVLNKSTPALLSMLLKLELEGVVQQQPGKIFVLNKTF